MKASRVFFLICVAAVLATSASANGPCERIENGGWGGLGPIKFCYMESTSLDSKCFMITSDRDESIATFYANNNKKLEHLPYNLGAKFPNLIILQADRCSIKELSRDNFKGLSNLQHLYLSGNQIEKIDDDTFEYMPALDEIILPDNKIKKINGRAFASLQKLTQVDLLNNECINERFYPATRIAELPLALAIKCGLTESEQSSAKILTLEEGMMAQSEELQALKLESTQILGGDGP